MTPRMALLLGLILIGPSFAGCTEGGEDLGDDIFEGLLGQVPKCDPDPYSDTRSRQPSDRDQEDDMAGSVGYATSPDRTLIRWMPSEASEGSSYTLTRTPQKKGSDLTETVEPVSDPDEATRILDETDDRWPDLSRRLVEGVENMTLSEGNRPKYTDLTVDDTLSVLQEEPRLARILAQRYYPVAIVLGQAYLDEEGQDGKVYDYTVEGPDGELGTVHVKTGQITPLPEPTDLTCISLDEDSPLRAGAGATWGQRQQQQRLLHETVFLRWGPSETGQGPEWVDGYDVYRAEVPEGASQDLNVSTLDFERVTEEAVHPNPSGETAGKKGAQLGTAESLDFYHVDRTPSSGTWLYKVAPRDLLGTPRDPVDHGDQLSEPVAAGSFDFLPPEPPNQLNATPNWNNSAIVVEWSHPNLTRIGAPAEFQDRTTEVPSDPRDADAWSDEGVRGGDEENWEIDEDSDLSHFQVYRSRNASAQPPGRCDDEARCWVHVGDTTTGRIVDAGTPRDVAHWYQVRAVDDSDAENPSTWDGPVHATLNDETPPDPPTLRTYTVSGAGGLSSKSPTSGTPLPEGTPVIQVDRAQEGDDTTRARIACRFPSTDNWTRIATVEMEGHGAGVPVADHYDPPSPVEADCRARAVDEQGNVGEPGEARTVTFGRAGNGSGRYPSLPTPIPISANFGEHDRSLLLENRALGTGNQNTAGGDRVDGIRLNWSMPDVDEVEYFSIVRFEEDGSHTSWELDRSHRSAVDKDVEPGETYSYTITAHPSTDAAEASTSRHIRSSVDDVPDHTDIELPRRKLGNLDLAVEPADDPDHVRLMWQAEEQLRHTRVFAAFRSLSEDSGYQQITPVQPFPAPDFSGREEQGSVEGAGWSLVDEEVHRNYHYVVVEFDRWTGEPIRTSDPEEASGMYDEAPDPDLSQAAFSSGVEIPAKKCPTGGSSPRADTQIRFANGFEVVVHEGGSDGSGTVTLDTMSKEPNFSFDFEDVLVNNKGIVCQGRAVYSDRYDRWDHSHLDTTIHEVVLGPWGTDAVVDAEVKLPGGIRYEDGDVERRWLPLDNATIHADEPFELTGNVSTSCAAPEFGFRMETAPVTVIPRGTVNVTQQKVIFEEACTKYTPTPWSTIPEPPTRRADRNDGYLRPRLDNVGKVRITSNGLDGRFGTDLDGDPVSWTASAPLGFDVQVDDAIEVAFEDGRIAGGELTGGSVEFSYPGPPKAPSVQLSPASFDRLELDSDGRAYGTLELDESIEWKSLEVDPDEWELLLGNVTFDGKPGRALVGSHPTRVEDVTGLGETWLEPGLNLRTSRERLSLECGGPSELDVAADAYVRESGVGHVFSALIDKRVPVDMHGYDGSMSTWARAFLDHERVNDKTAGTLPIPDPSDVDFDLDPMRLDDRGCVDGGSGFGEKTLTYWDVDSEIDTLDFRGPDAVDGPLPQEVSKLLFARGGFEIPHLDDPSSSAGDDVFPVEYAFLPHGDVDRTEILLNRARYEVDGYPFLFEGFRFSDDDGQRRESPGWVQAANLQDRPDHVPMDRGFLELEGRLITPYFGALTSASGEPPKLQFTTDDPYLGFDRRPRVEKTWVDTDAAQLVWSHDLTYVQGEDGEPGRFMAFQNYSFLPLGKLFHALEQPERMVEGGFDDARRHLEGTVDDATEEALDPIQEVETQRKETITKVATNVSYELGSVHNELEEGIDEYFRAVRDEINKTDSTGSEAAVETAISDYPPFDQQALRDALEDLSKEGDVLDALIHRLLVAQTALAQLQQANVDTERMLRTILAQVRRVNQTLTGGLDDLPGGLGDRIGSLSLDLQALHDLVEAAESAESTLGRSLENLRPALAQLSDGLDALQTALEHVEASIDNATRIVDRALQEMATVKVSLQARVPDSDGAIAEREAELLQLTYVLQSRVKGSLETALGRSLTEVSSALLGLDEEFQDIVPKVARQVEAAMDELGDSLQDDLNDVERLITDQLVAIRQAIEEALQDLRIVSLDVAPVIEPGEIAVFLGMASGVASMRATAETRGQLDPSRWRDRVAGGGADRYKTVYDRVDSADGVDSSDPGATVDDLNTWLDGGGELPETGDDQPSVGGGTQGVLRQWGVHIDEVRGSVVASPVGPPEEEDHQVEKFELHVRSTLGKDPDNPAFHADRVGMSIDRHGEYLVSARNVSSNMVGKTPTVDADLLINTSEPRFEGGLTVYTLEVEQVTINEAGAAVGVGATVLYVGIKFDGRAGSDFGPSYGFGGVVLAGVMDPESEVLRHHFPDAIGRVDKIADTEADRYAGLYLDARFDMPLETIVGAEFGCALSVSLGGRLGIWYFQEADDPEPPVNMTGGLKVGAYAFGEVLCSINARGEITLTFVFTGNLGPPLEGKIEVKGTGWMAVGVGECKADTWKGWSNRWWGDDWCAQGGGHATIEGSSTLPGLIKHASIQDPRMQVDAELGFDKFD